MLLKSILRRKIIDQVKRKKLLNPRKNFAYGEQKKKINWTFS
jgi:hypothetical protein